MSTRRTRGNQVLGGGAGCVKMIICMKKKKGIGEKSDAKILRYGRRDHTVSNDSEGLIVLCLPRALSTSSWRQRQRHGRRQCCGLKVEWRVFFNAMDS